MFEITRKDGEPISVEELALLRLTPDGMVEEAVLAIYRDGDSAYINTGYDWCAEDEYYHGHILIKWNVSDAYVVKWINKAQEEK